MLSHRRLLACVHVKPGPSTVAIAALMISHVQHTVGWLVGQPSVETGVDSRCRSLLPSITIGSISCLVFSEIFIPGCCVEAGRGDVMTLRDVCRLVMKKQIHKKTIIRDGKEETIVTEDTHVEQDNDGPEELRDSMQTIIDQFITNTDSMGKE